MLLTKEQILERRLKTDRVKLEDGGEIMVRAVQLHVIERVKDLDNATYGADAFVFVNAVIDEQGNRIYTDDDAAKIALLETSLVQLVVSKAYSLSALTDDQRDAIKKNWISLGLGDSGE